MAKIKLICLCFLLLNTTVFSQVSTSFFNNADAFFKANVENGRVNYKKITANPTALNALLLKANETTVTTANKTEYQAFWINAYNLTVIKGIVDNYPLKSPLDVNGFFDKTKYNVGGIAITLNDIEHKMLRAKFPNEPRFHFVLVCGGLGCPPLINSVYAPATLDKQLQAQTTLALNNDEFIRVDKNKVQISQIFEWYTADFTLDGKSLFDFINRYRTTSLPEKAKLSYYPYNWALNQL